jgi:hypothetical protein
MFFSFIQNKLRSGQYVACCTRDAGRKACDSSNKAVSFVRFEAKVESVTNFGRTPYFSHIILKKHVGNTIISDSWVVPTAAALNFPDCLAF